jgi:predicted dinucleotide-binding enzyme
VKVFIIGSGNVGSAIAKASVAARHEVTIFSLTMAKLADTAATSGAHIVNSIGDGAKDADLVFLAIPASAVADVVTELKPVIGKATVVDATNPLNETYTDLAYKGQSAAADLQALLPDTPVVKAFNTLFAGRYESPSQKGAKLQIFLAGNNIASKKLVGEYAASLGFDSVDVGSLRFAKSLEEMAFLNISFNAANGLSWQSAWSLTGPETLS